MYVYSLYNQRMLFTVYPLILDASNTKTLMFLSLPNPLKPGVKSRMNM